MFGSRIKKLEETNKFLDKEFRQMSKDINELKRQEWRRRFDSNEEFSRAVYLKEKVKEEILDAIRLQFFPEQNSVAEIDKRLKELQGHLKGLVKQVEIQDAFRSKEIQDIWNRLGVLEVGKQTQERRIRVYQDALSGKIVIPTDDDNKNHIYEMLHNLRDWNIEITPYKAGTRPQSPDRNLDDLVEFLAEKYTFLKKK